ncbi:AT-rich interactive domain-containing protein 1A-like [Lingula anatina]|uniref:AT-rich interactive domain-containing protein 1A-like n=1 Tax=Lingula anatina TaxID=7574 RepID=A0A1S3IZA0_LINAN|nr:AT-rich interactive domain-containing protein 1A-like [Lingula anatina]|eukprot:XP_013403316.1 AT-rich interactive domain-containing protein 1A-like [Lingula anatina]
MYSVQYKPVQTHGPVSKSTPVPPIPEEISPVYTQQGRQQNRQNKENDPPLSQKYLQPGQAAVPLRHMTPQTTTPPTTQLAAEIPLQKTTRLSQQIVVPKLNPRPQPPLVSSYFPSKPKTT